MFDTEQVEPRRPNAVNRKVSNEKKKKKIVEM